MADYVMEMPSQLGKWRKFLYQNQATTGRVLPESQFMASLQGAYDSAYDNYYRNKALSLQQENSDRNYDLQRQQLEMQKDYYDDQNSLSTKLGGGATELGKAYLYGKALSPEGLSVAGLKKDFSGMVPDFIKSGFNTAVDTGKNIAFRSPTIARAYNKMTGPIQPGIANTDSFAPEQAPIEWSAESGAINSAEPSLNEITYQTPAEWYAGLQPASYEGPVTMTGMSATREMTPTPASNISALSPYSVSAINAMVPGTAATMTVSPAAQMASQAAQKTMMEQIGVAPVMTKAGELGAQGAGAALAAEEGTKLAASTAANTTGSTLSGLGSGLAGGVLSAGVGVGLNYLFDEIGMPKKMAGPVAGMASGAVAGAAMTAWSGPGAIIGAAIGGVMGVISNMFDSWICGMVDKHVGMTEHEKLAMNQLKDWCKENQHRWLRWYIANGCELVECIEADEDNMLDYCSQLRITMIEPVVALVDRGDLEGAYKVYKTMAGFQFAKYAPHILIPESFMMERKEAYAESATA